MRAEATEGEKMAVLSKFIGGTPTSCSAEGHLTAK